MLKSYFQKHPTRYSSCCLNTKFMSNIDPESNFDATYHYYEESIQDFDQILKSLNPKLPTIARVHKEYKCILCNTRPKSNTGAIYCKSDCKFFV